MAGTLSPASLWLHQRAAQVSVPAMPGGQRAGTWPCWLWVPLPTFGCPHRRVLVQDGLCPELTSGFPVPTPAQWAASRPRHSGPALPPTQCATEGVRGLTWGWALEMQKLGRVRGYRSRRRDRTSGPTSTPLWGLVSESLRVHAHTGTHTPNSCRCDG